jgi:polar amino acid transport system substrate-binding protein
MRVTVRTRRRPMLTGTFAVAAVVSVLATSACGGGSDPKAGSSTNALKAIQDRGTITIGSCLAEPPWGLINGQGQPDGFDVDLANAIAKDLGVKLETVELTSASRIPSLQTGKVDVVSCSFTVNDERKKQIDFTDTTILQGNSLAVPKDSPIKSLADLTGKTVAVSKGGTSVAVATAANPKAVQQPYESYSAAFLALQQHQADAMIDTSSVLDGSVAKDPNLKVVLDGEVGPKVNFALGVKKGEPELLARLNQFVKQWHASKSGTALYAKWFGNQPTFEFQGLE